MWPRFFFATAYAHPGVGNHLWHEALCSRMLFFRRLLLALLAITILPFTAHAQQDARTMSAYDLLLASAAALKANHVEDAVFDFYAGQLRRRLEMGLFPPDNEGDESEGVYALQYELGSTLNKVAFDHPQEMGRALDRYDAWSPVVAPGFKPAWKSSHPVPASKVLPAIATTKQDFAKHMRPMAVLLSDPEYYRQFHTARDCNMQAAGTQPKATCDAANAAMLRIEKQKGIEGVATMNAKGD